MELVGSTTVSGADVQDIAVTGLDGNADAFYVIRAYLINGAAASAVTSTWYPNGSVASTAIRRNTFTNNAFAFSANDASNLNHFVQATSTNVHLVLSGFFVADSERFWYQEGVEFTASPVNYTNQINTYLCWDESTTNVTSITLHGDQSDSYADGSFVAVYKP